MIKKIFVESGVKPPIYVVQQGCPVRKFIEPEKNISQQKFTIASKLFLHLYFSIPA